VQVAAPAVESTAAAAEEAQAVAPAVEPVAAAVAAESVAPGFPVAVCWAPARERAAAVPASASGSQ